MYGGGAPAVGGGTRHLESSIPLILIVILAIFIAGNFGLLDFSGVPVLSGVFGGKTIKVGVVGRVSPELKNYLVTEEFRAAGIYFAGELRQELLYAGSLKPFDIVILQGQPTCDRNARRVISDWAKQGGKLIVIGDACTRVTEDPTAVGWDVGIGLLGDVVPAKVYGLTPEKEPIRRGCSTGKFKIIQPFHPIFSGIKHYDFSGQTIEVIPNANAEVLAYVDCSDVGTITQPATYAIIESKGLLVGKTLYFAYDPGQVPAREMLLNALKYMKGQKG